MLKVLKKFKVIGELKTFFFFDFFLLFPECAFPLYSGRMIQQTCYVFILLAILVHVKIGTINANKDNDCLVEHSIIICKHSIPTVVPYNISTVIIEDYLQEIISNETFAHESWSFVDLLDITVNQDIDFSLSDHNIFLTNLKHLGIHSPRFEFKINTPNILEGLPMLKTLNLSSCYYLNALAIVTIVSPLRSLDTLILDQVAIYGRRLLILDNTFFKTISMKNIRRLSMSGCNLMVKSPFRVTYPQPLLYDLDISNTSFVFESKSDIDIIDFLFSRLKILDSSNLQHRFLQIDYNYLDSYIIENGCDGHYNLLKLLIKLEHLKINKIFSKSFRANNSFINLTQCKINLKSLQLRSNNIHYFNVTVLWPDDIHLIDVDMSSNGLEYLASSFLGSITSLEVLNISGNNLYHMESLKEFKYLLTNFKKLKHLYLSENHLTVIPSKMFTFNINLTMLDLSYNKLTTISFDLKHLKKLLYLDLRNNDIHYIESVDLNNLKMFVAHSFKGLKIQLEHNPLLCKCETSSFIKWLHVYMTNTYNRSLTCFFNDKDGVVITKPVIEEIDFSCIRPKIIIATITTAVLLLLFVSMATTFIFYKKAERKRMRKRGNFLKDFKLGNLPEKYLCFASYSSDDDDADIQEINAHINQSLQDLIHTEKEVLCDSNKHFNLGFSIIAEVLRCINECCVGIFYVSNSFCQSHWCELELRETYELKKPIILIFKEEIDERDMSPLMLKIFRKFTRAKIIVREDGHVEMIPDVKQLSNSIIMLASLHYDENIEQN